MNRTRLLFVLVSVAVLLPVFSGALSVAVAGDDNEDSLYKYLSVFSEVLSLLRRTYVEETSVEMLFAGAMDGTTDALDAVATYIPAAAVEEYQKARAIGPWRSGLSVVNEGGINYVLAVMPGSPAAAAGLVTGDILAEIDGASTRRLPLWRMQMALADEPGTELTLEVLRRGKALDKTLVLGDFEPPGPSLERRGEIAVLRLPRIEPETPGALAGLLAQLAGDDELVVDLRGAAGGDFVAAYAVGDLFTAGEMGRLEGPSGVVESYAGDGAVAWQGRLAVLTDRGSQGASEVVAAVLQQSAGADLVGERTFGHAGRDILVELSSGSRVLLTDAFYTGPDGEPLKEGLTPSVPVRVGDGGRSTGEVDAPRKDAILERALELLRADEDAAEQAA